MNDHADYYARIYSREKLETTIASVTTWVFHDPRHRHTLEFWVRVLELHKSKLDKQG
jgi:hypothetical protein